MLDGLILVCSLLALGQILLSIPLLMSRVSQTAAYWPLIVFLFAMGIITLDTPINHFQANYYSIYITFIFPAWLLVPPSLCFYVQGLTSQVPWKLDRIPPIAYAPFLFGVLITGILLYLPNETRNGLFSDDSINGKDSHAELANFAAIAMFLLMISWAIQSCYYVVKIINRLINYRKTLKDQFANQERRSLLWLNWVLIIIVVSWGLSFVNLLTTLTTDNSVFDYRVGAFLILVIVWTICYCGLKQKPGYEGNYLLESQSFNVDSKKSSNKFTKYQSSALDQTQSERIREKIKAVMSEQSLYLKPGLTLQQVSQQLVISPNYISQTLNETMDTNFFDYINSWRVASAKPKIIEDKMTVLDIAYEVGFNARSSFYKAFKKETGMTPSEFRKSSRKDIV